MASIQARMCRGYKYWYIVESKKLNGKPRPIVVECLGSTEKLVARLQNKETTYAIKLSRKVEISSKKGKPKVSYQLEETSPDQLLLLQTLNLTKTHLQPLKIEGMGAY